MIAGWNFRFDAVPSPSGCSCWRQGAAPGLAKTFTFQNARRDSETWKAVSSAAMPGIG
ncbi:uncharacterized protein LDX57_007814 [Aspergillus melleus]|uniref:uncharacterized protein n=1 Tax=Aspergillus melleus TaxID=138277 RepID=UPI001E8DB4AC|nr:uncharacterized protein LDX57_007814 [Aspergillus melleus]KAH8430144.1 hypothetical protein LDX57_007814 [Aspergillus melleus]